MPNTDWGTKALVLCDHNETGICYTCLQRVIPMIQKEAIEYTVQKFAEAWKKDGSRSSAEESKLIEELLKQSQEKQNV
jgi:hypothetical protein